MIIQEIEKQLYILLNKSIIDLNVYSKSIYTMLSDDAKFTIFVDNKDIKEDTYIVIEDINNKAETYNLHIIIK